MDLNRFLFLQIQKLSGKNKLLDDVMIFGAEIVIYLTTVVVIILGFFKGGYYYNAMTLSGAATPIALILILLTHIFIKEKRPFIKFHIKPLITFYKNLSFPSTHTTFMSILVFSQIYYHTPISTYLFFLLLWIAFARIYSGLHYPIDILGGLATGFIAVIVSLLMLNTFSPSGV